ncbi:MAG TPA: LapA family protein [Casimicrobiaceae bacterium]
MSVLRWIVIAIVFIALLFISLQNADPVTLRVFTLYAWQAPLVFVVLIAFASGVALGLLAGAIKVVRLKRQLARLRREQRAQPLPPSTHAPAPGSAPASGPGFEPPTAGF